MYLDLAINEDVFRGIILWSVERSMQQQGSTIFRAQSRVLPPTNVASIMSDDMLRVTGGVIRNGGALDPDPADASSRYFVTSILFKNLTPPAPPRTEPLPALEIRINNTSGDLPLRLMSERADQPGPVDRGSGIGPALQLRFHVVLVLHTEADLFARLQPAIVPLTFVFDLTPPLRVTLRQILLEPPAALNGTPDVVAICGLLTRLRDANCDGLRDPFDVAACQQVWSYRFPLCFRFINVFQAQLEEALIVSLDQVATSLGGLLQDAFIPNSGFAYVPGTPRSVGQIRYRAQIERGSEYTGPALDREARVARNNAIVNDWRAFWSRTSPVVMPPGRNFSLLIDEQWLRGGLRDEFFKQFQRRIELVPFQMMQAQRYEKNDNRLKVTREAQTQAQQAWDAFTTMCEGWRGFADEASAQAISGDVNVRMLDQLGEDLGALTGVARLPGALGMRGRIASVVMSCRQAQEMLSPILDEQPDDTERQLFVYEPWRAG